MSSQLVCDVKAANLYPTEDEQGVSERQSFQRDTCSGYISQAFHRFLLQHFFWTKMDTEEFFSYLIIFLISTDGKHKSDNWNELLDTWNMNWNMLWKVSSDGWNPLGRNQDEMLGYTMPV